jgi:hypothetical protein
VRSLGNTRSLIGPGIVRMSLSLQRVRKERLSPTAETSCLCDNLINTASVQRIWEGLVNLLLLDIFEIGISRRYPVD